ncbi:UDP-glucose 4-epimerase GalE [Capnocytophaga catalasegens]|uniref:UDP-glucose 4-epimerase n=1 Tax=Capnocytophaga catalasegens TaxID=1004260 RepID=A0AAV5AY25_9FLAO|nr:UDP-glucose 4-epimerase GalE [Capnocytophaga catalasegens]GIZ16475.1 UDP-glucose 4-epimerase [Capnocytophaga catalasegens]GJM50286.1 UDP-glucose 4-epimerase [Capnocytophaga catalasegens]GJM53803.1 UDP-glucose 4-epimerase [Capnocytophaga catalasegens]
MSKVLVTGGLGFIGSHTVVELQQAGHQVIIIDDLSNSSIDVLDGITRITGIKPIFEKIDLRKKSVVDDFFKRYQDIDGVIHFAASKAVGESVEKPLLYYENNISSLVYILQNLSEMQNVGFIFSSSCTVYGQADQLPITENAPVKKAESPYGNTKQIDEEIIADTCRVTPQIKAIALRYFNPIGAHPSAEIGELPIGVPQNLVPFITQTAAGIRKELSVFGNDYPTPDGTCIRDYIHVVDLAKAHVIALQRILEGKNKSNYEVFNVGTGKGSSVLEVIQSFERVSGVKLNYKIVDRRAGDIVAAYANTDKANNELGWKAISTLDDAMKSAWEWEKKLRDIQ